MFDTDYEDLSMKSYHGSNIKYIPVNCLCFSQMPKEEPKKEFKEAPKEEPKKEPKEEPKKEQHFPPCKEYNPFPHMTCYPCPCYLIIYPCPGYSEHPPCPHQKQYYPQYAIEDGMAK